MQKLNIHKLPYMNMLKISKK